MKELRETGRRVSDELAASPEEILSAIEALTEGQLVKLQRYAKYRMRGLGRRAAGRDHEDLLTEAMTATLAGNRRWNKNVDFLTHMVGVMRSISSHWGEQHSVYEPLLESELAGRDDHGEMPSFFVNEPSHMPSAERILSAKEELARIEQRFAADPLVPRLIEGLKDGLTGPEIQVRLRLTKRQYETGLKRLRRGLAAMEREGEGYVH